MFIRKFSILLFVVFSLTTYAHADPIRIGLSLGLTGKYTQLGKMQERSFRLWEKHTNDGGGVLGRKIKVIIYDDQSSKAVAKKLYERMVKEEKMDLLFPPYSSGLTASILPITEPYGYPLLASGASADSIWKKGYKNIFGVYSPASRYTLGFMEMALAYDLTKLAVISADDPFSLSLAKGSEKWAERLGLSVVVREIFKKGSKQLDSIAQKTKDAGVHAVIMCGHFDESVNMRRALKNINWYPKAYYASVGPVLRSYSEQLGGDAENTFSSTQWMHHEKLPFPGGKEFYDEFTKAYNVDPSYQAASAYAAGVLLVTAIEKSGSLDKKRISAALASLDKMTLLGRYGVDRTGMQIRHFAMIIQWINNKKEIVWPNELRTARPVLR